MGEINTAYSILYTVVLTALALFVAVALVRSVRGPEICDRILAINMIGTLVTSAILILGAALGETWLYDISLVYVLISFLAVAILATVYIQRKRKGRGGK